MSQSNYTKFLQEDSVPLKIEYSLEIWNYFTRNNIDSLKIIGLQTGLINGLSLFGRGVAASNMGSYFIRNGDGINGIKYLSLARECFLDCGDNHFNSLIENELGNAHLMMGNFSMAAGFYSSSMSLGKVSSDETDIFNGMIGLGKVFCAVGDTTMAIKLISIFLSESIQLGKYESSADAAAYLAMIYGKKMEFEMMNAFYKRSIIYADQSNSKSHISSALNNEAIIKFTSGQLDSSLILFRKSLDLRLEFGQKKSIIESYFNIGEFYLKIGKFDSSEVNYLHSLKLAEKYNFLPDHLDVLKSLVELYELRGDKIQEISALELEINRIEELLEEKSSIDDRIYKVAMTFEESIKKLFETKPRTLMNVVNLGGICLLVLMFQFYRLNKP